MSIEDNMKQITDLASQLVKEESSAINPILPQDNIFVNKGWQCPICGRVYSPTTPMCFYCCREELKKKPKAMNEVSIIINGVRYDAVDKLNTRCSLCAEVINELCCNSSDNGGICYILKLSNKVFKKSDKKFEL